MSEPEDYDRLYVVVVGGMNVDVKARSFHAPTPGASNPGTVTQAPGGVGRNIAETLARLGTVTHLVSALGNDDYGKWLLRETRHAGVRVDHVQVSEGRTGRFVAMLDNDGELVAGVADMSPASIVTPEVLESASLLIGSAAMLVLDANLPSDVFARAHRIALDSQVPVVVDPSARPRPVEFDSAPRFTCLVRTSWSFRPLWGAMLRHGTRCIWGSRSCIAGESRSYGFASGRAVHC